MYNNLRPITTPRMTDSKKLLKQIKEIFINEDDYQLRKVIEGFDRGAEELGNYYNFIMFEDMGEQPPVFYHVMSPFDSISNTDPQHAIVWQGGEILLNADYTDYAAMRTGAMDSLTLQVMQVKAIAEKKILIIGTGRTAKWSIEILKTTYPDLQKMSYISSDNQQREDFESFAAGLGVEAELGTLTNVREFDYIFCHTNASGPILTVPKQIKKGAVITNYISGKNYGEVSDDFYTRNVNVVLDWDQNQGRANGINRAIENDSIGKSDVKYLRHVLNKDQELDQTKDYTVFRYLGTPMQNLAVLKLLTEEGS